MPCIKKIGRFRVCIYSSEHPPPHVHVEGPDTENFFNLETLKPIKDMGKRLAKKRELKKALDWIKEEGNRKNLLERWQDMNNLDKER